MPVIRLRGPARGWACRVAAGLLSLGAVAACSGPALLRPELAAAKSSALELSDALEKLIADGKATEDDREAAYDLVQTLPASTAGDAFGRAAIAGRLAEIRGALSILGSESPTYLATEAEKYALLSQKLDPAFRDKAATRMLGTLYVLAPANMLEGGDSEEGLEILETLVRESPDVVENQFRLAEALIALGDKEPAKAPLCIAIAKKTALRADQQRQVDQLVKEVSGLDCKPTTEAPPAPSAPPAASQPPSEPPPGGDP